MLLYDERSPVFVKKGDNGTSPNGLWTFLLAQAPPAMAGHLHAVTIQQVVAAIEASSEHQDWIGIFKEKYGLVANCSSASFQGKDGENGI